jgi:hypothetical protein
MQRASFNNTQNGSLVEMQSAEKEGLIDGSVKAKIDKLLLEAAQRDPYKRFTILAYQLADVGKCMRYMEIYPDERNAYREYLKTALSDLLIQCIVASMLYQFDTSELIQMGAHRLEEFKKKGRYEERQ